MNNLDITREESIETEYAEAIAEANRKMELDAKKQATKILNKNKREIDRLKKHAGECLIHGNEVGYKYAIKKLRRFYKQPYTEELVDVLWKTSRENIENLIKQQAA